MRITLGQRRAQQARNRAEAKALVETHGEQAEAIVNAKLASTAWQIRDHSHWQRVEKHVKALLN